MIRNLEAADSLDLATDILVIGGGTVGLAVAVELARRGQTVICVESGLARQEVEEHPLNEVTQSGTAYQGAAHGRFRCLGGTSTRWGGALIPFQPGDLASAHWPVAYEELIVHLPEVGRLFGLAPGDYSAGGLDWRLSDFEPRLAKWPVFAKRNIANLLGEALQSTPGLEIFLDATATDFAVEQDRLTHVTARSLNGGRILVRAREVIFSAGAIETTRLLLLLDRQNGGKIFAPDNQLGRGFSDHLSVVVADLDPIDRRKLNRVAGFRFEAKGAMRNLRFELADATPLRDKVAPCFAHIAFDSEESGGFNALRETFRYLQKRSLPPVSVFLDLAADLPWLARAVWWRFVERRLLYPDRATIQLHMVAEQKDDPDNRISLSSDRCDSFGQPLANIHWTVTAQDQENLAHAVSAFACAWENSALAALAKIRPRPPEELHQALVHSGGIYHPVGSTRMGDSPENSVVDADLRPYRLKNVTVLATSVLPRSGGANPTMMLFLLAYRCMDRLAPKTG